MYRPTGEGALGKMARPVRYLAFLKARSLPSQTFSVGMVECPPVHSLRGPSQVHGLRETAKPYGVAQPVDMGSSSAERYCVFGFVVFKRDVHDTSREYLIRVGLARCVDKELLHNPLWTWIPREMFL